MNFIHNILFFDNNLTLLEPLKLNFLKISAQKVRRKGCILCYISELRIQQQKEATNRTYTTIL